MRGKTDFAISHLEKAVKLKPQYGQAHYNLGLSYLSRNFIDKADKEFRIALNLGFEEAQKGIAFIKQIQGK